MALIALGLVAAFLIYIVALAGKVPRTSLAIVAVSPFAIGLLNAYRLNGTAAIVAFVVGLFVGLWLAFTAVNAVGAQFPAWYKFVQGTSLRYPRLWAPLRVVCAAAIAACFAAIVCGTLMGFIYWSNVTEKFCLKAIG